MGLSGPAARQTSELSPAFGWTWWSMHMSLGICNCEAPGQRSGRYDEDVVFLVVPDGAAFGKRVPLVIGTCTLARVINIIKESELDQISTPLAMVCLAQLLLLHVVTEESPRGEASRGQDAPTTDEMDKVVVMKDNVYVGPFQTEILKVRVAHAPAHDTHLTVVLIRHADVESGKACPLPPGLQVLHAYTTLTAGSKHVSIVVRNMMDSAIFLKKGVHVAHVVSAMLVPPVELPSEEQIEGMKMSQERMSVQEWQEKLMDKLNLDGLSEWSPHNSAIVRELLFSYHDIFAFEPNELGCTSTIKHEICINDDEPFKERFRHIPLPLLEEVHASLRDTLEAGAI